jgi:hypothetical protein
MLDTLRLEDSRRALLLVAGVLLGLLIALATAGLSWQAGAYGLGIGLAALVGLAQSCSA